MNSSFSNNILMGCGPHCSCEGGHVNGHAALEKAFVSENSMLSAIQAMNYGDTYTGNEGGTGALFNGSGWSTGGSGTSLNYKFISDLPNYYASNAEEGVGVASFNDQMIEATIDIFSQISSFANINFTETNNENQYATVTLATATLPERIGGWAYLPATPYAAGDVWINNLYEDTQNPISGNYAYYLLMHEIGHALGLGHSFDYFTGDEATTRFSVMAYDTDPGIPTTYMLYDIAAIQAVYGANNTHALVMTVTPLMHLHLKLFGMLVAKTQSTPYPLFLILLSI